MLRVTEFAPDRMIHITKLRKLNIWCAGNHQYMREDSSLTLVMTEYCVGEKEEVRNLI